MLHAGVVLEDIHENDWDNVVTCHVGQSVACTWSLQNKCIGKHKLKPHYAPKSATATVMKFMKLPRWYMCSLMDVLVYG